MKRAIFCTILLALAIGYYAFRLRNPYPQVEWLQDTPGAGERYVTFTPVLKSNHTIRLGPTVGADFATLRFKDTDNDGTKEAVVQSDATFTLEEYSPGLQILKHRLDAAGQDSFFLIKSEELPTVY